MARLKDFLPLTIGRLPGCPELLVREAVREACIEFCKRTRLIVDDQPLEVRAGERFAVIIPSEGLVYRVESVRRGATPLTPGSRHDFALAHLDVKTGAPSAFYLESDQRVVLGPIPEADEVLMASCVVRPSDEAQSVPEALYSDWREAIAAGARAWTRRHYQPWSDTMAEQDDRMFFEQAVSRANMDRARGGTGRSLRAKGHFF